jgi:hypothetical protein
LFVKNSTSESITSTINFGGSSYNATNAGASMFVGIPNESAQTITWTNVYSYASFSTGFASTASITVPANTTVIVLLYTSSYFISAPTNSSSTSYGYHAQFLQWRLNSIRSGFLVDGLEIDLEQTLKAWQCPGFAETYQLFT